MEKKAIGVLFILICVGTSVLFFLGEIDYRVFWLIMGLCALVAWVLLPRLP